MKTLFYSAIVVLSLFLVSCKKDGKTPDAPVQQQDKVPVRFSLSGFGREVTDMDARKAGLKDASALRDSALQQKIRHLYLIAYEYYSLERRGFVHQNYAVDSTNFGILSDTLAPGKYVICIVGSDAPSDFGPYGTGYQSGMVYFLGSDGLPAKVPDTYVKKFEITVGANDSVPYTDITLNRIISNLEVNVQDATDSVEVIMDPESSSYNFGWDQSMSEVNLRKISKISLTKYADNVVNHSAPFNVTIKHINRITLATVTKVVPNVRCYPNKKTVLTGNVFTPEPNGFKISLNDTWAPGGDVIEF